MKAIALMALAPSILGILQEPDDGDRASILRKLHDGDYKVRWKAIRDVEIHDLQEAGPRLIELLADPNNNVAASRALDNLEFQLDPLVLLARVQKGEVTFEAAKSLLKRWSNEELHGRLLKAVLDEHCSWREDALHLLGQSSSRVAVPAALAWMRDTQHPLRAASAGYVAAVKAVEAIPILRAWAASSEAHECQSAIRALVELDARDVGPDILKIMKEGSDIHRQIPGCGFSEGFEIFDYRKLIAATSAELIVPTLAAWLGDSDPRLRGWGAEFLAQIGHSESIPTIGALLKDPDKRVQSDAIESLGILKARDYLKPILEIAGQGNATAAEALGKLGGKEAVATLLKLVEHSNEYVRLAALQGLAYADPVACEALLAGALKRERGWVLNRTIAVAGRVKATRAAPVLVTLVDDPDQHVREYARTALRNIRPRAWANEIADHGRNLDGYERNYVLSLACSLGSRSAGETLIADAAQGKAVPIGALNALRAPDLWQRLISLSVARNEPIAMAALLKEAAAHAGVEFLRPPAPNRRVRRWLDEPDNWSWNSVEEFLTQSESSSGILIDSDGIRLVTPGQAITFWTKWLAENPSR